MNPFATLINTPYTGDNLDSQLTANAIAFINAPQFNKMEGTNPAGQRYL